MEWIWCFSQQQKNAEKAYLADWRCPKEYVPMRGLLFSLLITATVFGQDVPSALKRPVTDEYHGVKVVDDYRWLEDGKSAETQQWLAAENAYSLHYFQHAPAWNLVLHNIKNPKEKQGAIERGLDFRRGRFFYLHLDRTAQQQAVLMTSASLGTPSAALRVREFCFIRASSRIEGADDYVGLRRQVYQA
jgi:hypothetical protein